MVFFKLSENSRDNWCSVKWLEPVENPDSKVWNDECFIKVGVEKKKKEEPIVKHVILKDSCGNYETIKNSLKEAETYLKDSKIREAFTIYELVAVERLSPNIKVEKLVKKRGKKK